MDKENILGIIVVVVIMVIMITLSIGMANSDNLIYQCRESAIAKSYTVEQINEICK